MEITAQALIGFKGGQMEIQNQSEGYIYRGEIKDITIEDNDLKVEFNWLAKGEGFPPIPKSWKNDTHLDYAASLEIFSVTDIGLERICLCSHITNETVVIFPPSGSKLDPKKVEGLQLIET